MKKNIIFLDIDGVLNGYSTKTRSPNGYIGVDQAKIALLQALVTETDSDIVLFSSWKSEWNTDIGRCTADGVYLIEELEKQGLHILDAIPDPPQGMVLRGSGIRMWLQMHPETEAFVVLDDEFFRDYKQTKITRHLIRTSPVTGITQKNVDYGIRLMNKQHTHPEMFRWTDYGVLPEMEDAGDFFHFGRP